MEPNANNDQVSVCVCTYKRTEHLTKLLNVLQGQVTDGRFAFSIAVVDNDYERSAEQTVEDIRRTSPLPISYCVEPEQNIALARNKAIANARGEFIVFIDDDEVPVRTG